MISTFNEKFRKDLEIIYAKMAESTILLQIVSPLFSLEEGVYRDKNQAWNVVRPLHTFLLAYCKNFHCQSNFVKSSSKYCLVIMKCKQLMYSHPFNDEPELTLSACDLPENVKLIESYKYSSCGKWKVLSGNSVCEDDSSLDDECSAEGFSYNEENQYSSYESDDKHSVSSECSGSFQVQKSFRNKHPRTCVKTSPNSKLTPPRRTMDKNRAKTTQLSWKNHESARKDVLNNDEEDEHRNTDTTLTRYAGYSSADADNFKLSGTVTISKNLWSQVQQCLRLMTSVFSQLHSDCADQTSDNSLEKLCQRKLPHKERGENSIRSSVVKHQVFHDEDTSESQATVPQGQVIEKLFVRRKGSKGPGVELASRQTFLGHSTSKTSEVESLDSGFCHEIKNSSDVDVFTEGYTSTSSSACRSRADALPCHKTMVSGTSTKCCGEPLYLKSPLGNSMKSVHGCQRSSPGRSFHKIKSPKIADEPRRTSAKNRRRRYRLVRRRSSSWTTHQRITSDTATSEHENESDTQFQKTRARKEHIFDQGFPASDTENFHIYAKTKNKISDVDTDSARCNSLYLDEVILVEAPHTPALAQITATPPESSQGNSRSSTPRKQIYSRVNNTATTPLDLYTYLRKSAGKKHNNTHVDSIPSPIKSVLSPNIHHTETWPRSCESFISNDECFSQSSFRSQSAPKDSLPGTSKRPTPYPILQPEISIDFIKKKDILNTRFVKSEGKLNTQNNGRSCNLTMTESSNNIERKGKHATSDKLERYGHDSETFTSSVPSENQRQFLQQKITPRRAKFHPYAVSNKFRRSPSLSSTFQDLTIKSPTPSCNSQRWTTLDRSPVAVCVAKARRMSDSVSAPQKILDFSSNEVRFSPRVKENSVSRTKKSTTKSDRRIEEHDISLGCSSGKCTKMFCFNCSMDLS